jgi:hypothetical protein
LAVEAQQRGPADCMHAEQVHCCQQASQLAVYLGQYWWEVGLRIRPLGVRAAVTKVPPDTVGRVETSSSLRRPIDGGLRDETRPTGCHRRKAPARFAGLYPSHATSASELAPGPGPPFVRRALAGRFKSSDPCLEVAPDWIRSSGGGRSRPGAPVEVRQAIELKSGGPESRRPEISSLLSGSSGKSRGLREQGDAG